MLTDGRRSLGRLSDRVYEVLREEILSGRLRPGQHLPLQETAAELGVSTTPLRDAFGLLVADGLVEWRPRHGAYVAQLTAQAVEEAFQVREFLECGAIGFVLQQGTEVLVEMQDLAEQLAASLKGDTRAKAHSRTQLELRFHGLPIRCVGNDRLSELYASLNGIVSIASILCGTSAARCAQIAAEHQTIVDALRQGDVEQARATLRTHLRNACLDLVSHLPKLERQESLFDSGPPSE